MDYVLAPFTIVIDTREQAGYDFRGFKADADKRYAPLVIPIEIGTLQTGDYSLKGYEDRIAIERKSKADCFSTFSQGRDRFERELERMRSMDFAAVVVEATLGSCQTDPPEHTKFSFKSFYRSYIRWMVRYRVPFIFCPTKNEAERATMRMLQGFWLDEQERNKLAGKEAAIHAPPQEPQRAV